MTKKSQNSNLTLAKAILRWIRHFGENLPPIKSEEPIETVELDEMHTYTVEGYNSLFRHFLAQLKRKTKCYSQCQIMLQHSVRLLMAHRNQLKTPLK